MHTPMANLCMLQSSKRSIKASTLKALYIPDVRGMAISSLSFNMLSKRTSLVPSLRVSFKSYEFSTEARVP